MEIPQSPWTDALAQKLADLWPNHSAGQICEIFARDHGETFTRNQIIGKAHRMGICKIDMPKRVVEKAERPSRNVGRRKPPGAKLPSLPFVPRLVEAAPLHVKLPDLVDDACRYECSGSDNPAEYTFCGNPKFKGSYCCQHAKLVFVPARPPQSKFREWRAA